MNNVTLPLLFFAILLIGISDAFSMNKNHRQQIMQLHHGCSATTPTTSTTLLMSEEDQQQEEEEETTTSSSDDSKDDEKEEEEKKPEDSPEVKDLKEKIAKLESTLAEKKSSLQYNLEQVEEYSKSGYARKVAEMENMKRVRSVSLFFLNL
jgi:flagellar motility protein MotE (MotC chaperone)